ncbi:nucleotidyltransferase domain-containing protein [Bacillus altitudinis]|uniref:nucleotidyltransferase domain-containing protein n=1 Tax=Bacillus altitudinis TaxID=293387 RepID=UPI001932DFC5|nr:nucleotidyltransferase domain-containing protein [Bacillus altitudinis]QRF83960.1 nucleotidyltransferase domain-containing protein [Bacillus altitudinis]
MQNSIERVDGHLRERIKKELKIIEETYDVKICLAVESGSRAWGFPSTDSDYDVRFLYVPRKEWYWAMEEHRDVIERPIDDMLDISGWELRKALRLFNKSNPSIMEWLSSDIIYAESFSLAKELRELKDRAFYPAALMYHYLNMAKRNESRHLRGEQVRIKKYFYVLRPLLACQWIERYRTVPPMDFHELLKELVEEGPLLAEIHELLKRKMDGEEMDVENRLAHVHPFIDQELARFDELVKSYNQPKDNLMQELNELLQSILDEVWA